MTDDDTIPIPEVTFFGDGRDKETFFDAPVRLAGDINAGNNDVTLDELLVTIKSEMVKLGPLIGLDPNQLLLGAENRSPVTVNGSEPEASSPLRRRLPNMGVSSA